MKVERLTGWSTSPLDAHELAELLRGFANGTEQLSAAKKEEIGLHAEQLAPFITPAVEAIATLFGVIIDAGDYRVSLDGTPKLPSRLLELPIAPVLSIATVSIDTGGGWQPMEGVALHRGGVMPPAQGWPLGRVAVNVELLAGWPSGRVPHLARIAVAQLCAAWAKAPDLAQSKTLGPAGAVVSQMLQLYTPRVILAKGGAPWRR